MWLLREELAEHGTTLRALNSLGDSAEAELGDAMMDQVGRYFRRKMAEKTAENKVKKAREGKIVAAQRCPNYGFVFNESRDAYLVDPETMSVVKRSSGRSAWRAAASTTWWARSNARACGLCAAAGGTRAGGTRRWYATSWSATCTGL